VVGLSVVGLGVVGLSVVGLSVVGLGVVGLGVVGLGVGMGGFRRRLWFVPTPGEGIKQEHLHHACGNLSAALDV
jgi:hypothetical protein